MVGCRTKKGFSVVLVEKQEGVIFKSIKTSYSAAAATTFIEFKDVKVPAENLLGEEDKGFIVIMSNFNHERWMICCWASRWNRTVLEECLKWTHQRIVAGKPLISLPVIVRIQPLSSNTSANCGAFEATKAGTYDCPLRGWSGLAGADHISNEPHELP